MSTFITKSFLDHSLRKNYQNFSPAAGNYLVVIKLTILTFDLIINFKTASGNSLYFQIASRLLAICVQTSSGDIYSAIRFTTLSLNPNFQFHSKAVSDSGCY